jgi:hypothetical protein
VFVSCYCTDFKVDTDLYLALRSRSLFFIFLKNKGTVAPWLQSLLHETPKFMFVTVSCVRSRCTVEILKCFSAEPLVTGSENEGSRRKVVEKFKNKKKP